MKIILLSVLAAAVLFALGALTYLIGFNNTCVTKEQTIKAQWNQNRNNYDNFIKAVQETAQIPTMYTDDLKKVYDGAIKARYGVDGSKALFQFIKEQNPNLDVSVYTKIQQIIEAGRVGFMQDQKLLIDRKRDYETYIQVFPGSLLASLFGFPRIDMDKYDIVTSDDTENAFKNKKAPPVKVR